MPSTASTSGAPPTQPPAGDIDAPHARVPRPFVPGPVAAVAAAFFGALSRVRGARIFHPKGVGYDAVLAVEAPRADYADVSLLARPGRHPALVRFSYAAGLPDRWPDALGLALRISDVYGVGRHQDFLLITSGARPLSQHLILPAPRGFRASSYSSLLPYRFGNQVRVVAMRPLAGTMPGPGGALADLVRAAAEGDVRFDLCLGALSGGRDRVARLEIGARMDDRSVERLAFNPWHTGGGIRPVGPLMGLRRPAYAGSQRGRRADPGPVEDPA